MDLNKLNKMYRIMESNLAYKDKPCVGLFWYSEARDECFGVIKARQGDENYQVNNDGLFTCSEMHRDVWKKEFFKHKFHPELGINLFIGDYKDKPRGRIFYDYEENTYYIMVGSWINRCRDKAVETILKEFHLHGTPYSVEENWLWDEGVGFD